MKLRIEQMKVADLAPYAGNAKEHPDWQVEQIANSIEQFGFNDPVGVWTNADGVCEIVEGHGRVLAAKRLGMDELPVIRLDHLDDDARRAYVHVHNQTTLTSGFDLDRLQAELDLIKGFEWVDFGFGMPEEGKTLAETLDDVTEDDVPEQVDTRVKRGQVWRCGEHRVMCGDSSSADDLGKLLNGERPKFVFTDPPYGVAIGDKNKLLNAKTRNGKGGAIEQNILNDDIGSDELHDILVGCFTNLRKHCADDCSYYVASPQGGDLGLMMMMMMMESLLAVRHTLIWVKNAPTFSMGRLDYDYRHEVIFYTWTKSHNFYGGYGNTVIDDTMPIDKMSKAELKDLVRALRDDSDTSVVYCDKPHKCDLHPTMKPVKLVARFMFNSSAEGDICADIFGGSGTTMIAAEQLGRKARLMELDPHYCDVIIERWERFTGEKAELLN